MSKECTSRAASKTWNFDDHLKDVHAIVSKVYEATGSPVHFVGHRCDTDTANVCVCVCVCVCVYNKFVLYLTSIAFPPVIFLQHGGYAFAVRGESRWTFT